LPSLPKRFLRVALLAALLHQPAAAQAGEVALTFDDLPGLSLPGQRGVDQAYVEKYNRDLLAGLRRHRAPAIGFVNEGKLKGFKGTAGVALLRGWLRAGMDLGNHTYSHESLNTLGAARFEADVVKGEHWTRLLLARRGERLEWFRYPNLETGTTPADKLHVAGWLAERGYRSAPVTIDPDDWEFAEPYDAAVLHHDLAGQARIRAEYLDHSARVIDWSRRAARALFDRDIPYVVLLHDSRLNADCIDSVASLFEQRGLKFVSLDRAMNDPAYGTPDPYVGDDGIEWLERWSMALHRDLPWDDFPDVPAEIQASYDKLESDRN